MATPVTLNTDGTLTINGSFYIAAPNAPNMTLTAVSPPFTMPPHNNGIALADAQITVTQAQETLSAALKVVTDLQVL